LGLSWIESGWVNLVLVRRAVLLRAGLVAAGGRPGGAGSCSSLAAAGATDAFA